jgi:hypothetical protein
MLNFMQMKYISIEVRDSSTDQLLLLVPKAVVTLRREAIQAENIASIVLDWKAIGWQDEITPKYPVDKTREAMNADRNKPTGTGTGAGPAPNLNMGEGQRISA